jgi:hypothetical protein
MEQSGLCDSCRQECWCSVQVYRPRLEQVSMMMMMMMMIGTNNNNQKDDDIIVILLASFSLL